MRLAKKMSPENISAKVQKINEMVAPFTVPLMLLPSIDSQPNDVIASGSGALISTGQRDLLITCHHVWMKFLEFRASNKDAVIGMGRGTSLEVAEITDLAVVDSYKALDLAIIDLTDTGILDGTSKRYVSSPDWPPQRPEVGEFLVAMGFPGSERCAIDEGRNIRFRSTTLMDYIVSVSDRHVAVADEDGVREIFSTIYEEMPEGFSFGGMSGCPAFVNRNGGLEFSGILYESDDDKSGIFFFTHADLILSDGRIDWPRVPPE